MITSALVMLAAAIFVAIVFHSMKLPPIVAFITAGILIGPSGFKLVGTMPQAGTLTEIAAVLLMFTIGLEFSFRELLQFRRPILILGLGQILASILVFTLIFWLGFSKPIEQAIFISFLIALSSTAVVLKLLYDNRDFESPYGKATFSVLLLQDIAVIPMIVAVPFLVSRNSLAESFVDSVFPLLLLTILVVIILYLISKYALPFVLHRVSLTRNREIFFFTVVFICLGSAALMHAAGLSVSLGAFVAGMLLAGSHYGKQATAEILPLRDSFLSLFFVAIGMMLDLPFLFQNFHKIFLMGTFIVIIKTALIFALVWVTGNTGSVSRAVALLLFQFGEFSFILAELGVQNSLITEKDRQFFVAIAITSLALTPIIYKALPYFMNSPKMLNLMPDPLEVRFRILRGRILNLMRSPLDFEHMRHEKKVRDHVVVIGYGVAGQSLCRVLQHLKIPFQVIELNAETVRMHNDSIPIIYGDAANVELLKTAGVDVAKLIVIVTSGVNMLQPILHTIRQLNPIVPVLARTNYLLDLKKLTADENTRFVISELETSLEVIHRTLNDFKIEGLAVDELLTKLRAEFGHG